MKYSKIESMISGASKVLVWEQLKKTPITRSSVLAETIDKDPGNVSTILTGFVADGYIEKVKRKSKILTGLYQIKKCHKNDLEEVEK